MTKLLCYIVILGLTVTIIGSNVPVEVPDNVDKDISTRLLGDQIRNVIELLRQKILEGLPTLGISTFDPLKLGLLPLIMSNKFMSGSLFLTNFKLEGLAGFTIPTAGVTLSQVLSLRINFGTIKLSSNYRANMDIFQMINLYGAGELSILLNNFDIDTEVGMNILSGPLEIKKIKLTVTLPTTSAEITGLLNDEYMSGLISQQLSDTLTTLVKQEHENVNRLITNAVNSFVKNVINPFLKNYTLEDIINIIGGGGGGGRGDKERNKIEEFVIEFIQTRIPAICHELGIYYNEK